MTDWSARVEKKEQALKKMMATVLKDKSMIEDTIVELDRYKRDALTKTWEKVNGWVKSLQIGTAVTDARFVATLD